MGNLRWLVVGCCLVGCSSGGSKATQTIGDSGGMVAISDGTTIAVPGGALTAPTPISIAPATGSATPSGTQAVGMTYLFGPEGTQFAQPVAVTLAFSPDQLPAGAAASDVVIYTAPADSTEFTGLETSLVDATHVRASTSHFSVFVPVVRIASGDGGTAGDLSLTDGALTDAGSCTHAWANMNGICNATASCGGHAYQLSCRPNDLGMTTCTCSLDNAITVAAFPVGQTCLSTAGGDYTWSHTCSFP
jgi:hypothetical protein